MIVNNEFKFKNLLAVFVFSLLMLTCQVGSVMTIYTSGLAQVNEGVIATIYSLEPLIMTFGDRIIFGTSLQKFHYVGLFCILVSSVVISLSGHEATVEDPELGVATLSEIPTFIPVVTAVLTAFSFCAVQIFGKHLTSDKGFNAANLTYTAYIISSTL